MGLGCCDCKITYIFGRRGAHRLGPTRVGKAGTGSGGNGTSSGGGGEEAAAAALIPAPHWPMSSLT